MPGHLKGNSTGVFQDIVGRLAANDTFGENPQREVSVVLILLCC